MKTVTCASVSVLIVQLFGLTNVARAQTAPDPAAAATPPPAEPPSPPPEAPASYGYASPTAEYSEPPLPPPRAQSEGSKFPDLSVRVDPFNWLLAGRLGLELEVQAWKFISVEVVPIFVTSQSPPLFNFAGRDKNLTQHSDGLGALSGSSLAVGFWLSGEPFRGTVLRGFITNYAYNYKTQDANVPIDEVGHTENHIGATIGSYSRYGAFIIGGEIGLSSELNSQERCLDSTPGCGELQLRASDLTSYYNLNGPFHPIYLEGNFSLGIAL